MNDKKVIVKANNLCKTYISSSEQFHAIKNLSVEIYEGDFTVIMGNSGSGKSTLLYLLSGLDAATVGEVYFRQDRIDKYGEKKLTKFRSEKIGYIYQSINLVPDLTIFENIVLPGYITGQNKKNINKKAVSLMEVMDIEPLKNRLPSQTSGGQQQRAAIARALINSPDMIFADEPTGSLNYDQGVSVLNILTDMNRKGQSVVMVTHDIKAACRADRVIYIKDGKIDGILIFDKFQEENITQRETTIFSYITNEGDKK